MKHDIPKTGTTVPSWPSLDTWSLLGALVALYCVLKLELLSALLAGLLISQIVHSTVPLLDRMGIAQRKVGKVIALTFVTILVTALLALGVIGIWRLTAGPENLFVLFQRMAEVIDTARTHLPPWISAYLPGNIAELEAAISTWLRNNAWELRFFGRDIGLFLTHTIVGMIIGGMIAFTKDTRSSDPGPLTAEIEERVGVLGNAFRNIVFSQLRISALNTTLTAIYLAVILPMLGVHLPFLKVMVVVTFIVGLLPVIGNLISNTVIVLVSFSVSPWVAAASLVFLVVIHKLEYFVNARIIGSRINARAWELLLAMLVMDAWFGIPGLIAAPIYYAYVKDELTRRQLI